MSTPGVIVLPVFYMQDLLPGKNEAITFFAILG